MEFTEKKQDTEDQTITLEQIAKLKEFAGVSYTDARAALEATGGNLLDALLWLEQEGKIPSGEAAAAYSTRESDAEPEAAQPSSQADPVEEPVNWMGKVKRILVDNRLEAYHRKSGREFQIPIGVCLILLILAFWMVPVLLIAGFVMGWRYRLAGPDLDREDVNQAMEKFNDTAEDVVSDVVSGVKKNFTK